MADQNVITTEATRTMGVHWLISRKKVVADDKEWKTLKEKAHSISFCCK